MKIIIPFLFLLSVNASAIQAPQSDKEFCYDIKNKNFYKELLSEEENRLSFNNYGGLLNAGVCWWHSRFTRNISYLAIWKPELSRPNSKRIRDIIKKLINGRHVVTIPGYKNLHEFSRDNEKKIEKELEDWQIKDGTLKLSWINGILGPSTLPKSLLKYHMNKLYKYFLKRDDLIFLKAQLKGIEAHSFLLMDMEKTKTGYTLLVADSNFRDIQKIEYKSGMNDFDYYGTRYIPYIEYRTELKKLKHVQKEYCQRKDS